jgi:RNA polymerase primary sigma factor
MSVNTEVRLTYPDGRENEWVGDDIVGLYWHDARKSGRIDIDELSQLSKLVQDGIKARELLMMPDEQLTSDESEWLQNIGEEGRVARNEIVVANTGLVNKYATAHKHRGVDFTDLLQAGNLGLIRAAEKFDPDLGYAFSTYAIRWIRSSIERYVHEKSRTIALPREDSQSLNKLQKIIREHAALSGEVLQGEALAIASGYSLKEVNRLLGIEKKVISFNMEVGPDEDVELNEFLIERDIVPEEEEILDEIDRQANIDAIQKLLANTRLDDIHMRIIRLKFGFDNGDAMSLTEIGELLGKSRSTIASMAKKAIKQLSEEADEFQLL